MTEIDRLVPPRLRDCTKRALLSLAAVAICHKRLTETLTDFALIPDEELPASVGELFCQMHDSSEAFSAQMEERAAQLATFTAEVERLKVELLRRGSRYREQ